MDKMLERLNRLYPNSGYVSIAAYNPETFADRKYDSSFDTKVAQNRWNTNPLTYEQAVEQVEKETDDMSEEETIVHKIKSVKFAELLKIYDKMIHY